MFSRALPLCRFAVLGVALAATPAATAQLAAKSPFLPPAAAGGAAPTANAALEFRAIFETGGERQFRLYDPAKKAGTWVKLNERNAEFDVVAKVYEDSEQGKLTVELQGKQVTLALRQAKVVSSGSAPPPMPPPMPSNVPAAVTQAVVLNPSPADEQRRLDAVAAEVQRRRALRDQAAQQINNPGATPPAVMPQPIQPQPQPQGNLPPGMQRSSLPFGGSAGQRVPVPGEAGAQPR